MEEKLEGFTTNRHVDNPREKELHDKFVHQFNSKEMQAIAFGESKRILRKQGQRIMISTIQWLGSIQGIYFLKNVGYCEEKEFLPKEKLFSTKIASLENQLDKIPKWIRLIYK